MESDKLQGRVEKVVKWIKNPYNFAFLAILALTIIIRIYFFSLTKNQPIWWDEADYLAIAKVWAFNYSYDINVVRPVLFPFIVAGFFKIANNEFLPRVLIFLLSIVSVIFTYYLGKETYNKKIGLIASLFISVFYLNLFFTFRLLVDIPSLAFFTLSAFLFYRYFKKGSKKALYLGTIFIALGTLFKLPTATLLFAVVIYVLLTEGLGFIKKKEYWIAVILFLLILSPYFIWGYAQYGEFVITAAGEFNAPKEVNFFVNGFRNMTSYFKLFPLYLTWSFLIIFLLGIASLYKLILGFDMLLKNKNKRLKRDLFMLLIFIMPIIIVSFSLGHIENRYILNAFPAIFIFSGVFIMRAYKIIKKYNKILAIILIIFLLGFGVYTQIKKADDLIQNKKDSYLQVKEAGIWLGDNAREGDIVITKSIPQIAHYSEKKIIRLSDTEEEFELLLKSEPNISFFTISVFETHPEWAYSYPQRKNLTIAKAYFADPSNTQPLLIIYNI